jgi:hypothetical protein
LHKLLAKLEPGTYHLFYFRIRRVLPLHMLVLDRFEVCAYRDYRDSPILLSLWSYVMESLLFKYLYHITKFN